MFDRFEKMIGIDKLNIIKDVKVLVVGLGGVGGHSVLSLIRSGIENITLIDYDTVDITNLNRQVVGFRKYIGRKKTEALKDMILDINPNCKVKTIDVFLSEDNIDSIITDEIDYIVDACDTVRTKKAIIKIALDKNIKIISSMGTGNKLDPQKLQITDIRKTINDPLARIMRKWVKDEGIKQKIPVVSSTEIPIKVEGTVASNSFVPAVSGLFVTSYIINNIIKKNN